MAGLQWLKGLDDLSDLQNYFINKPQPLAGRETVQIALIREVQDYTILRTEETRELNTVWTPAGPDGQNEEVERVAFLATKQKGAESRELEGLLRSWNAAAKKEHKECYLKSQLCMECPRCILFGATDVSGSTDKGANIKHRIAYATAFSLLPVDPDLRETHTFNGIDGATQLTGQTLNDRESVRPGALFASIVTLRSVTEIEFILSLITILACTRYGAETRIGGFVRNHVAGLAAAYEEILSPLELTLELAKHHVGYKMDDVRATVADILNGYKKRAAMSDRVTVLKPDQITRLLEAVQRAKIDATFLDAAYGAAGEFRKSQAAYLKKAKKEKGG